ncbi:MAG: adenylosuccinate lyase, partial [Phycisphaerales bacterium]|nr:adenylosuccinate lyase [Phycisphaerales bacterium]
MAQMRNYDVYESPLVARNASPEMVAIFSPQRKFSTWRRIWLALAEAQKSLGLPITDQQIAEMKEHLDDIDFEFAAKEEARVRHDVMAHLHTFAKAAPSAKPILHLGATSMDIVDNTDVLLAKDAMGLV